MIVFLWSLLIIFALGWGSFATMAVYRLPQGKSWISQKPYCTECKANLKFIDYIPFISYWLNGGKCRYCNNKYSYGKNYFVTEVLILLFFITNFYLFNFSEIFILNAGLIIAAVVWSVIMFFDKKNIAEIFVILFYFVCLKRVFLDFSTYNIVFIGAFSLLLSCLLRHLYYFFLGDFKLSKNYLEFKEGARFASDDFIIIKISLIYGLAIANFKVILISLIAFYILLFFIRNLYIALPIIMNILLVINLFFN